MGLMAITTDLIGVHTVLGAFVAGILVGESPILSEHIEGQLRGIITALFMPVFFGMAGLSANLTVLADPTLALLTAGLVLVASVGKFTGAFAGGKLAGMSFKEATAVGSAMNARGSTEVIVASIGLSMNILSPNRFTMIVTMAVLTTLAMPPMLRWALRRLPADKNEQERLDREALDERGFVSRLERLLLAVDDSPNGRFTAYLAGLVGGSSGMPTTVLRLEKDAGDESKAKGEEKHLDELKKGAKAGATAVQEAENTSVEKARLTARTESGAPGKSIAEEARKGYDLLFVGLGRSQTPKGAFTRKINEITRGFDGPLCLIVKGSGKAAEKTPVLEPGATILVPVNGTETARRAADLAFAIARPQQARVKALYVAPRTGGGAGSRVSLSHRREEAALKDIADLAERYGVPIKTAMKVHGAAADAITRQAAKGVALVVMGVAQRSGDELFFGETASAVLAGCTAPVVLVAGERVRKDEAAREAERSGKSESASQAKEAAE
jgi:nucleotide-binding universal stress UspA family protein